MARTIRTPDGTEWKIAREWLPWRLRLRKDEGPDFPDLPDLGGSDELGAILFVIFLPIFILAAILLGWFVLALAIELMILVVGLLAGLFGRTILRRPWVVHAWKKGAKRSERHVWKVRGWRASRQRIDEVAGALERGLPLPGPAQP